MLLLDRLLHVGAICRLPMAIRTMLWQPSAALWQLPLQSLLWRHAAWMTCEQLESQCQSGTAPPWYCAKMSQPQSLPSFTHLLAKSMQRQRCARAGLPRCSPPLLCSSGSAQNVAALWTAGQILTLLGHSMLGACCLTCWGCQKSHFRLRGSLASGSMWFGSSHPWSVLGWAAAWTLLSGYCMCRTTRCKTSTVLLGVRGPKYLRVCTFAGRRSGALAYGQRFVG